MDMFQKTGVSHSCVKQTVTFDVFEVSGAKRSFLKERGTEMKWWTTKKETVPSAQKRSHYGHKDLGREYGAMK